MSPRPPLNGIEFVLIDGNNLLHRQRQGTGDAALRMVLVGLQRALPVGVRATFYLDGHPAPGTGIAHRVSHALDVRHSGNRSADDAIVAAIGDVPWATRGRTIVVTDDRALTDRSRSAGALTRRLDWLTALPAAPPPPGPARKRPTLGAGRPPRR